LALCCKQNKIALFGLKDCPARDTQNGYRNVVPRAKIPMGVSTIWCGSGCQRFLIGLCLSQADICDKTKLRSFHLSFVVVKTAWALKRGKWPQKGVIWGLKCPEMALQFHSKMAKFQNFQK
jgi:hypothetical protein